MNEPSVIKSLNFHCGDNNAAHRTARISGEQLLARRGQSFLLTLEMTRPFRSSDPLLLTVETGPDPSQNLGTRCEFGNPSPTYPSGAKAIWRCHVTDADPQRSTVTLSVTPPPDAPVGRYSLSARTADGDAAVGTLVVLFNPWCSDDWVHLPDERERQEYVMNEEGIIYYGTSAFPKPMTWVFGQFEEEMLDIVLKILDVNPKHARDPRDDVSARCNPIYVGRVLSAMVNSVGDRGVLEGRWFDSYDDGVKPTHWTGSVSILRRWYQSNCRPVKYGQCWVFAGVMCTVMRFLGIPCRVVTNFESAHDTNTNLTIDKYYDDQGERRSESKDSVWNFHVWVEGWMKRPDLHRGAAYDGWQVLDPTPQEMSEGTFCCGPAPVAAILQGEVNLKYDVPFVFAEVNADIIKWMVEASGAKRKILHDTSSVGQNISTKAVDQNQRDDITHSYKYREGSERERAIFRSALRRVNPGGAREEQPTVQMEFEEETKMVMGQDIRLKLKLNNRDHASKVVSVLINAQTMLYDGRPGRNVHSAGVEKTLPPGRDVILPVHVPFSAYGKHLSGRGSVKVSAVAIGQDLDDIFQTEINISLDPLVVSVEVLGEVRLNRPMTLELTFTNPLEEPLTNCRLTLTGFGLFKSEHVEQVTELAPLDTLRLSVRTTPFRVGPTTVSADFDCSAFMDVKGNCSVFVRP